MCRWVWQSGDGERRESPRTSGGWKEHGNGGEWGMWLKRTEEQTVTVDMINPLLVLVFSWDLLTIKKK